MTAAPGGVPGLTLTDRDIGAAVMVILHRDPGVDAGDIQARVSQGIVELTGHVGDLLSKQRAARVVEAVKGVRTVSDRLQLRMAARPDHDLQQDVQAALSHHPVTGHYDIAVGCKDGEIVLDGSVPSYQTVQLARWLAEGIRGVKNVEDRLTMRPTQPRQDAEIQAEVASRLRWDALVNDRAIRVSVQRGVVSLRGEVASAAERRRASSDAWVLGVSGVNDSELRVASWRPDLLRHESFGQSDESIAKAIRDAAAYDPRVSAADLNPRVNAGFVELSGTVASLAARSAAEELARNTVGVLVVRNELEVRPLNPLSDAELASGVRQALKGNPYTNGLEITVSVASGRVSLRGQVSTAFQRAQATTMASCVEGIRDVDNELRVTSAVSGYVYHSFFYPYGPYAQGWYELPREPIGPDSRVTEAILAHLQWNPFVDASEVQVQVASGKATLSGQVSSYHERIAATEAAYEGGALLVDNQLRVSALPSSKRE